MSAKVHRIIGILLLLFFIPTISLAQNKRLEKAKRNFEEHEYLLALDQFKKLYREDNTAYEPLKYIANSYRKLNDYVNAELFYTLVVNSVNVQAEDYLYYGQVLKANGKLAAAKEAFLKFSEKSENSFLGNLMVQSFDQVESWEKQPKNFIARPKVGLNSEKSEYNLLLFRDMFYITSNRAKNHNSSETFTWDNSAFTSIYELDTALIDDPEANFKEVGGKMNTEYHDGPITINKDQYKAIVTRIDNQFRGKDFVNKMKLYEGLHLVGKWKNFKPLPFNSDEYSTGHATYGENDSIIYFISDRPGGYGGMDIYMSRKKDDKWGEPENLGPTVNTASNELFPYYRDNKLYFSSNGFAGYGGLDILVSEYNNGWQSPVNLKSPINSSRDDFGIYFVTDSTGYYASNREGGKGEDDIYDFYKSAKTISVGISGIFEYKGLPHEGVKVILKDANDSIIAIRYTDEKGRFTYNNLPYSEDLLIEIEAEDFDLLDKGRLYLADEDWNKIQLIERLRSGEFAFKALPPDEIIELEELEAEDSPLLQQLLYAGKVYKELPGDYDDQTMVYLMNENGDIVDSVLTDEYGNFEFKKLGLDQQSNYFVKMEEIDTDVNIAFVNEEGRYYKTASAVDGKFKMVSAEQGSANKGYTGFIARLEHMGKALPFTRIDIYDEANNLIATVFTNDKGEFQYNKLKLDQSYLFELPEVSDTIRDHSKLYVVDREGDPLYLLRLLQSGRFSFTALPFEEYKDVQELEESLVPELVELKGQVYKKLQGDYKQGLKVYLLDSEGGIVDSVFTDEAGKFNFEKLDPDKNYSFKVDAQDEFNMALLDKEDKIIEQAIINEQGNFSYQKLTYQVANFEPLEVIDAELIEDELTHEIMGQVFQRLPGDFDEGMEVYIYSKDGELVGTALTDGHGRFHFKKLHPDEQYYFRIEHHEEDFQLVTLDDEQNILDKTIKNEHGHFKYHSLDLDHHRVLIEEAEDHHQILYFDEKKIELDAFTIYYRFDTTKINTAAKSKLNTFADLIRGQHFIVEVHSYTDNRGPHEYNVKLSKARTDEVMAYLISRGIPKENIIGNYYGELKPTVDCEKIECDNDDHLLNRKTVLKLRLPSDMQQ